MNAFEAALQQNIAYLERKLGVTTTNTQVVKPTTRNSVWHVSTPCPMRKPKEIDTASIPEGLELDF